VKSYKELLREINYLQGCLSFESYVYAACIGVFESEVKALGCIKFLNGVDHWKNRDKMFSNLKCKKFWVLVEEEVYKNFKNDKNTFLVKQRD
tara:strand:- start:317 stop:592 length:276 start_codon:yes stop_codon:yes gene_type:complete